MEDNAYVTLITNEFYFHGAIALGISLCKTSTKCKKVVLVSESVTTELRDKLACIWDFVIEISILDSRDANNLSIIGRPELGVTFSKLHVWELIQFKKCVFLDADTLVLRNIDELFSWPELSAAPDTGWPDCFNSGVFVFTPSLDTYHNLLQLATGAGSFDGADQGLLNTYWGNWAREHEKRLPFIFNVAINMSYFYNAAMLKYKQDINVLHYLGMTKPWIRSCYNSNETAAGLPQDVNSEFYRKWWEFYNERDEYFHDAVEVKEKPVSQPQIIDSTSHSHCILPDVIVEQTEAKDYIISMPYVNPCIPVADMGNQEAAIQIHDSTSDELPQVEMEVLTIEAPPEPEEIEVIDENQWRLDWQRGHIEYEGRDASDSLIQNILQRLK